MTFKLKPEDEKEQSWDEGGKGTRHRSEVAKTQRWTREKVYVSRVRSRKKRVGDRPSQEAGGIRRTMEMDNGIPRTPILGRRMT